MLAPTLVKTGVRIGSAMICCLLAMTLAFGSESTGANSSGNNTAASASLSASPTTGLSQRETEIENRFATEVKPGTADAGDFSLLSGAGAFTFVLCLAALATLLMSYFVKHKQFPAFGRKREPLRPRVRVLESIPLGQRRFLTLVETGGEVHLLGVTPAQVNYLVKLPGKNTSEAPDELRSEVPAKRPAQAPSLVQQLSAGGLHNAPAGNFEAQYKHLRAMLGGQ